MIIEYEPYELVSMPGMVVEGEMAVMLRNLMTLQPHFSFDYTWDDIGTSQLMHDVYMNEIRYCPQNDSWYIWDGCWRKQDDATGVNDMLQTLLNVLNLYCKEIIAEEQDEEKRKPLEEYHKYVRSIRRNNAMRSILEVYKTRVKLAQKDMDTDPYLLNTPSGAFDLRTGDPVEHLRDEHNVTKMTACSMPTQLNHRCERWYHFIDQIMSGDKEKAKFLQRALGYSILGVNREECMFIAYGAKTRNGKGTLFSTIQRVLSDDYVGTSPPDLICEGKQGRVTDFNAPQPTLSQLVGKRIVMMSESAKEVRLASASMKTMTGRDSMLTRGLFEKPFRFVPQFSIWLNTNHLPAVTDETVFLSNRIWVIEFNRHFEEHEQDRDLKEIFSDPENMPTILKWLVEGCRDYLKNGLNPPECVRKATENYRKTHDRIGNFLEEYCVLDDEAKIVRGELYAAYRRWCALADNQYKPLGSTTFYNEIAMRGFHAKRERDGWFIEGIKEKPAATDTGTGKIKLGG